MTDEDSNVGKIDINDRSYVYEVSLVKRGYPFRLMTVKSENELFIHLHIRCKLISEWDCYFVEIPRNNVSNYLDGLYSYKRSNKFTDTYTWYVYNINRNYQPLCR